MACFLVPATEAIITTIVTKVVRTKEKQYVEAISKQDALEEGKEQKVLFSRKLGWLNNMLWGGSALLAFEHVWHGEVVPFFPFLTAAANPEDVIQMLGEMSTVGVTMGAVVTLSWLGMVAISNRIEKRKEINYDINGKEELR